MKDLLERAEKVRMYYLGTDWAKEMNPNEFANQRLGVAALIATLGAFLPEAEKAVGSIKGLREKRQVDLYKTQERSQAAADHEARAEFADAITDMEYDRDTIKYTYDGLKEIHNALSSKISTLQDQARGRS